MPHGAAELAVGDAVQADLLLHVDRVADAAVLDLAQARGRDLAGRGIGARLRQLGRAQQAADMVGAERRRRGHAFSPSVAAARSSVPARRSENLAIAVWSCARPERRRGRHPEFAAEGGERRGRAARVRNVERDAEILHHQLEAEAGGEAAREHVLRELASACCCSCPRRRSAHRPSWPDRGPIVCPISSASMPIRKPPAETRLFSAFIACPEPIGAGAQQPRSHRLQHRRRACDVGIRAAHHDRELAGLGARDPARDRRVDHGTPRPRRALGERRA